MGCNTEIDYSNEMVLDQLILRLNDDNIQKKALSSQEEDFKLDTIEDKIITQESSKAMQKDSKLSLLLE